MYGRDWFDYVMWAVGGFFALVIVVAVVGCAVYPFALHNSAETRSFTVKSKERVGGDDGKYLVFTDHGVFSVEDSLWYFTWDASDRYNDITPGDHYTCKVAGWRIHFLSDYENLIDCHAS